MLLLTTAMNPFSERTTPRRLILPISRHFLPVLQPDPPVWFTTGLRKGSRLPFAAYLASGTTDCSVSRFSPSPEPLPAGAAATAASFLTITPGLGDALCVPATTATPLCFVAAEDFPDEDLPDVPALWLDPTGIAMEVGP